MSGQPYYVVVLKADQEHIRHALDSVKASYTVLPSPSDPDAYPRVGIDTTSWLPFLISERFYFEGDETRGRRIYRPLSWFVWPGPLSGRFV